MIDQNTIANIHILAYQGHSEREISRKLKISRTTVNKYLENPIQTRRRAERPSKLKPYFGILDNLIENFPGVSSQATHKYLQAKGYDGGITIVREYLSRRIGEILSENRKKINLSIIKAELFKCMVKGESYEPIITKRILSKRNSNFHLWGLSEKERVLVTIAGKKGNYRIWRYGVAIDMKSVGFSENKIQYILDLNRGTLNDILIKYKANGFEGVLKRKKPTKSIKSELAELKTKRIIEIIHQSPRFFGLNRSSWTKATIANVYEDKYHERISRTTVGDRLKKSKYSLKKARNVLKSSDPDYREKIDLLLKILHSLKSNEILFFIDEVGPMRVKKYGGKSYSKKGEHKKVPHNQRSKGSIIFSSALSATTNQLSWVYSPAKNSSSMIDLIEILYNQNYQKRKIYITWDAASWHISNELVEWLDEFNAATINFGEGPIIEFIPLPSNSQFLNIIESVFSHMKKAVIHNSNYQSEEEMKVAISMYFKERNYYFKENPKRAGKKIWEIDFFKDYDNIKSGNYREW
jgi:transposase